MWLLAFSLILRSGEAASRRTLLQNIALAFFIRTHDFPMTPDALWTAYCTATGHSGSPRGTDWFGDDPVMADTLLALVMDGTKRATCGLARDYADEPLPARGDHWIITDGARVPRCIIRTTRVELVPIREVTPEFAAIEGEGDGSLDYWKREHDAFFTRQAAREGFSYSDAMIGVCEQFECVWPK